MQSYHITKIKTCNFGAIYIAHFVLLWYNYNINKGDNYEKIETKVLALIFNEKELETTCATISHITTYNSLGARIVEVEEKKYET